jgi:hypothetical protein
MALTPADPAKAQIWLRGEAPNQILDIYVPRGARGEIGPVGPQGPAVPTTMTVLETTTGPETPGATGPQGVKGDKGDPGGWVTGTLLNASDLNLIITSGIYRQDNGTNIRTVNNYPENSGETGVLYVNAVSGTAFIEQEWHPSDAVRYSRIFWKRSYNYGVWRPWRAFAADRIDETAGRALYTWDQANAREQLIYGDTGWRDIMASDGLAGAVGWMRIRRTGNTVETAVSATLPDGTAGNGTLFNIPVGFRPGSPTAVSFYYSRTSAATGQITYGLRPTSVGLEHSSAWSSSWGEARLRISWTTNDNWPATLPGVAYSTINNA